MTVYDRGEAGHGASWAAAGMLAAAVETEPGEEPLLPLTLESQRQWPNFARELEAATGISVEYRGVTVHQLPPNSQGLVTLQILNMMEGGNQVAVEFVLEANLPSWGGGHYRDEEMHLWTFDDEGKVVRLRHYVDTAKHIAALQG